MCIAPNRNIGQQNNGQLLLLVVPYCILQTCEQARGYSDRRGGDNSHLVLLIINRLAKYESLVAIATHGLIRASTILNNGQVLG